MNPFRCKSWATLFAAFMLAIVVFATDASANEIFARDLPPAALQTLVLIKQGGPFPYPKDGAVFSNREGVLPKQKRGYYHEFTVETIGAHSRGARRIVAGGEPVGATREYFFTDDHYVTFTRIKE